MEIIIGIIYLGIFLTFPVTFVIVFDYIYQNKLKYKYPWDDDLNAIMGLIAFFFVTGFTALMLSKITEVLV